MRFLLIGLAVGVVGAALSLEVRYGRRVGVVGTSWILPESCSFHRMTGWDCPGCGMTRCFIHMAHGRLREAWSCHPVGTILFAGLVALVPWHLFQIAWTLRRGRPWRAGPKLQRLAFAAFAVVVAAYVLYGLGRLVGQMVSS